MRGCIIFVFFFAAVFLAISGCQKEGFYEKSDARLGFSTDTISFDTIFTTFGSTTKNLRIYNPYNDPVEISKIYVAGGSESKFRLNVDGFMSNAVENIRINPKDSMYVFVEVTIDPNNANAPMVISDSIIFVTNGNMQDVNLRAYGQDVHFFKDAIIEEDQIWMADKPYLVYNYLYVDTGVTLTIKEGVKIHMHRNAQFLVGGTLNATGSYENEIVFQGDRLEELYKDIPGQWGLMVFTHTSHNNLMDYCIIKNSTLGMQIGLYNEYTFPDLTIKNSIIKNTTSIGIYAFGAIILAENLVVANNGSYSLSLFRGGNYNFTHTTVGNFYGLYGNRTEPAVALSNFVIIPEEDENGQVQRILYPGLLEAATFNNSIIYGNRNEEILISSIEEGGDMNYLFDHCLIKVNPDSTNVTDPAHFRDVILNESPNFKIRIPNDTTDIDFSLDTLSPAMNAGSMEIANQVPFDIQGNSRIEDIAPDLGAYERKEE